MLWPQARAHLEFAVRYFPDNDPDIYASLAEVYRAMGDATAANRILRKGMRIFPGNADVRRLAPTTDSAPALPRLPNQGSRPIRTPRRACPLPAKNGFILASMQSDFDAALVVLVTLVPWRRAVRMKQLLAEAQRVNPGSILTNRNMNLYGDI